MQPPESWYPYRGRIIGLLIGLIIALLLITIGFGYTLLIVLLASIGFIIGAWRDCKIDITSWLQFFMK